MQGERKVNKTIMFQAKKGNLTTIHFREFLSPFVVDKNTMNNNQYFVKSSSHPKVFMLNMLDTMPE